MCMRQRDQIKSVRSVMSGDELPLTQFINHQFIALSRDTATFGASESIGKSGDDDDKNASIKKEEKKNGEKR